MSFPNRSILYDPTTLQGLDKEMLGDKIQIALRMTVIARMRKRERERGRDQRDQLKNIWVENITLEKQEKRILTYRMSYLTLREGVTVSQM